MVASGSTSAAANSLTIGAQDLPNNSFGFFLASRTQGLVAGPGGSQGTLCLGGAIGRSGLALLQPDAHLALRLLHERALGAASPWRDYIALLPPHVRVARRDRERERGDRARER